MKHERKMNLNKMWKPYFTCVLFLTLVFGKELYPNPQQPWMRTQIILIDGGTPILRNYIQDILTKVIQEINKTTAGDGNLGQIRQYCTEGGFLSIRELLVADQIYSIEPGVETNLIDVLPSGYFEVRGIKVNLGRHSTKQNPVFEYLVFTLDSNGLVADLRYALKQHQYENILQLGHRLPDGPQRRQILRFLEEYRTAYNKTAFNRENLAYLEKIFSNYALILVGLVVQERRSADDFLEKYISLDKKEEVRFLLRSKRQYLDSLRIKVFDKNSRVIVEFSNVEVVQHDLIPYIYGVTLKQDWKSEFYSDTGYLFLMFDFENTQQPIIHVRSWQPKPFDDGSVVNLHSFRIAPKVKW